MEADIFFMAKSKKRLRSNIKNTQQRIVVVSYSYDDVLEFWLAPIGFRNKEVVAIVEGDTLEELHEKVVEEVNGNPLFKGSTVSYGIDNLNTSEVKQTEIALFFADKNL